MRKLEVCVGRLERGIPSPVAHAVRIEMAFTRPGISGHQHHPAQRLFFHGLEHIDVSKPEDGRRIAGPPSTGKAPTIPSPIPS